MDIKNEVFKDFKKSLENIDFNSYNPNSKEFLDALNLGLMWKLLCWAEDESEEPIKETYIAEVNVRGDKVDDISKELDGAKIYLQKYIDSGDETFKELTNSELNNVNILIKKAYSKLPGSSEKQKLKEYEEKYNEIMEHLKSM